MSAAVNDGRCTTSAIRSSAAPSERFGTLSDTTNASQLDPAERVAPRKASSLCSALTSLPPALSVSIRAMNDARPGSAPSRREPPATVSVTCTSGTSVCVTTCSATPLVSFDVVTEGITSFGAAGNVGGLVRSNAACALSATGATQLRMNSRRIIASPSSVWRRATACLVGQRKSSHAAPEDTVVRHAECPRL